MKYYLLILLLISINKKVQSEEVTGITLNNSTTLNFTEIVKVPVSKNGDILSIDTNYGIFYPEEVRSINFIKHPNINFPDNLNAMDFQLPQNMESLLRYVDGDGSGGG